MLFRSSAVGIEGLSWGAQPIHLDPIGDDSLNPIALSGFPNSSCTDVKEISALINNFDPKLFSSKEFQSKEFDFHLKKIFSFTYRTNFADLPSKSGFYNSDCGWGCMIRASQMMLSKALLEQKIWSTAGL